MITIESVDDERTLLAAYQQEIIRYENALQQVEKLLALLQRGGDGARLTEQVASGLAEIANIEADIADTRRRWRQRGQRPGPELQALGQAAGLVQRLIELVDQAQQLSMSNQAQLAVQMTALAQSRLMQQAYGKYGCI